MKKPSLILNASLLISGILCGIFYGTSRNSPPMQAMLDKQATPRERFQTKQETKAFQQGSYDFYSRLNARNANYQQELSALLRHFSFYEKNNRDKLYLLFTQWGYESPVEALEAISLLPFDERGSCQSKVYEGWADKNPEALAAYYKENRDALYQSDALVLSIKSWAETDLDGALKFLSTLDLAEQKEGIEALLSSAPTSSPGRYKKIMSQLPRKALEDSDFLEKTMTSWLRRDPAGALEWGESQLADKQELLTKYKGMESLPPIDSLTDRFAPDSPEMVSVLKQYPDAMQAVAWAAVFDDLQGHSGNMEAVKWQIKNMPPEIVSHLINSSFQSVFSEKTEEELPVRYEEMLEETDWNKAANESLSNINKTYMDKFGARYPERVLNHLLARDKNKFEGSDNYSFMYFAPVLVAWIHDNPGKARPWMENNMPSFSEEDKKALLNKMEEDKPVMGIKNY